jgi:hypothetical protein
VPAICIDGFVSTGPRADIVSSLRVANGCTVAAAEGGKTKLHEANRSAHALQPKPPRVCGLHQHLIFLAVTVHGKCHGAGCVQLRYEIVPPWHLDRS